MSPKEIARCMPYAALPLNLRPEPALLQPTRLRRPNLEKQTAAAATLLHSTGNSELRGTRGNRLLAPSFRILHYLYLCSYHSTKPYETILLLLLTLYKDWKF